MNNFECENLSTTCHGNISKEQKTRPNQISCFCVCLHFLYIFFRMYADIFFLQDRFTQLEKSFHRTLSLLFILTINYRLTNYFDLEISIDIYRSFN